MTNPRATLNKIKHPHASSPARLGNRRGIALISVLAVLILLTVLVVAFLMRAEVARTSSANYRATTETRLLTDTVLNLVQAEINDATTYGLTRSGGPYTWASQPGAIRVYDTTGGGAVKIYRLYSAPSLTTTAITDLLDTTTGNTKEVPSNWASNPAKYVDLNAPVSVTDPNTTASNFLVYPILDNRDPAALAASSTSTQAVKLPGFYVNATGTCTYPTSLAAANLSTANQPVMPVQWLYVLASGQIIAPDTSSSGATATFTTAPTQPSATNPIVGRIAYWTDDDTCKININTAGGSVSYRSYSNATTPTVVSDGNGATGIFFNVATAGITKPQGAQAPAAWDTPRFGGSWDDIKLFAANQPVSGEYQRYPGHPATTVLYYLLYALGVNLPEPFNGGTNGFALAYSGAPAGSSSDTQSGGNAVWSHTSSLYGLLPRYNDVSGSQGGLADTTFNTGGTANAAAMSPRRTRLYTSLGELLYSTSSTGTAPPVRTQNGTLNGAATPGTPYLTRQQIETGKFFMTAHSRAPETTLFGTPRVAMWPVPDTTRTSTQGATMAITSLDKLIAFCSTTDTGSGQAGYRYYFERYDAYSATNDWDNANNYGSHVRNQELYGYLQDLTTANIPGYGGNFNAKYGVANERDQILTEMVDYIRCLNLNDHSWPNSTPTSGSNFASHGEVIPLKITKSGSVTYGLGREATLSEMGLHVICTADGSNNLASVNGGNTNTGFSVTTISGTSVGYNSAQLSTVGGTTVKVSPVIGSANDPGYVSNLPEAQFLRSATTVSGTVPLGSDGQRGTIVDIFNQTVTAANVGSVTPFPANPTLSGGDYPVSLDTTHLTPLNVGQRMLQAMLLFEPAAPMKGFDLMAASSGGVGPDFNILVSNSHNILIAGQQPFPSRAAATSGANSNGDGYLNGSATTGSPFGNNGMQGGIFGFHSAIYNARYGRYNGWSGKGPLYSSTATNPTISGTAVSSNADTLGTSSANQWITRPTGTYIPYRFISNPFIVSSTGTMAMGGGTFNVSMTQPVTVSGVTTQMPYQTLTVAFPATTLPSPPTLVAYGFSCPPSTSTAFTYATHAPDWWGFDNRVGWCGAYQIANNTGGSVVPLGLGCVIRGDAAPPASGWGSGTAWSWSDTGTTTVVSLKNTASSIGNPYGDVVRTIVPKDCDYRLTMAKGALNANPPTSTSNTTDFMVPLQYTSNAPLDNLFADPPASSQCTAGAEANGALIYLRNVSGTITQAASNAPKVPFNYLYTTATTVPGDASTRGYLNNGDWDNGTIQGADGAYANKPDEGTAFSGSSTTTVIPYININSGNNNASQISSYFTANRIVASPVAFGSLPTGVTEGIPWRTLLFRPQMTTTETGSSTVGRNSVACPSGPKDYLLLDNFWMPVVQPYAISEPFSTAGKINMNYQILPFTYIIRSTGVQAVLGSELIARVPSADAAGSSVSYAQAGGSFITESTSMANILSAVSGGGTLIPARLPLNLSEDKGSLRQFRAKFTSGDLFRSPAEICDIYLVPRDPSNPTRYTDWTTNANADYAQADSWYGSNGDFALVGDNTRERPYSDIYPRLTTKSNTYTVYYRVQVLKNPPATNQAQWNESTGVVTGEYRGSTSLERYLDPNNNTLPDFTDSSHNPATTASAPNLDSFYQWRTVANNAFAP